MKRNEEYRDGNRNERGARAKMDAAPFNQHMASLREHCTTKTSYVQFCHKPISAINHDFIFGEWLCKLYFVVGFRMRFYVLSFYLNRF